MFSMSDKSNDNNSGFIFKGLTDATAYFVISVIYPIYSVVVEFYSIKHTPNQLNYYALFSLVAGSIFFYATYAYDFILKFIDANNKKELIYRFLIVCAVLYSFLTIISFFFLMFVLVFRPDVNSIFNWTIGVFIITTTPCIYPLVEIFARIKGYYFGKISKAQV